ncbi:hypothetical protein [Burkholderia glumae]
MPWHTCTLESEYVQRLVVGVQANSPEHARQLVQRAIQNGTLLDDTDKMPTLTHAFEPVRSDGLQLTQVEAVDDEPEPDGTVLQMKCLTASPAFLRFAKLISDLCHEADDSHPGAQDPYIGIDVPTDKLREINALLNQFDL